MYVPRVFQQEREDLMRALIAARPLATLVVQTAQGLSVNHLPMLFDGHALRGHVARGNPLWREASSEVDAIAVFQGPQAYVSPSWYPSKAKTGEVVPTWNYTAVHAHGRLRSLEDRDWLRAHVEALTRLMESGRSNPWQVADTPDGFIDGLLGGIVGLELSVSRLEGKWKVGQNRTDEDRLGAAAGLRAEGDPESVAVAALMEDAE